MQALGIVLMVLGAAMFVGVSIHRLLVHYAFVEPLRRASAGRGLRTALRFGLLISTGVVMVGGGVLLLAHPPNGPTADGTSPTVAETIAGADGRAASETADRARKAARSPERPAIERAEFLLALARLEAALDRPADAQAYVIEAGDLCSGESTSLCSAAVTLSLGRLQAAAGTPGANETLAAAASLYRAAGMAEWAAVATAEAALAADGGSTADALRGAPPPAPAAMPERPNPRAPEPSQVMPPPIVLAPPPVPPAMQPSLPPGPPPAPPVQPTPPATMELATPPGAPAPASVPAPPQGPAERETETAAAAPRPTPPALSPPPIPKPAPGEPPAARSEAAAAPIPKAPVGDPGDATGAPRITGVVAPAPGRYTSGDNLNIVVTFDRPIAISGVPVVHVGFDSGTGVALLLPSNSDRHAIFRYALAPGDVDRDGIEILSPIVLNGGSIAGIDGTPAQLEFVAPDTSRVLIGTNDGAGVPADAAARAAAPPAERQPGETTGESGEAGSSDAGPYWVQLAALRTEEAAREEWQRLSRQQPAVLGGVGHDVRRIVTASGIALFRLRSGPFSDPERARHVCRVLAANGIACFVGGS